MNQRLVFSAFLACALAAGVMAWLAPTARGSGMRLPATIRCVNTTGAGGCYTVIQTAINASSPGDLINVASGTYTEHITMTNGVSVHGAGWSTTIITGNFSLNQPTVNFPGGIDATTVLSGVRVSGGGNGNPATSTNGSGIRIIGGSSPKIINTWLYSNTSQSGGGAYVNGASAYFENVPAWNNTANYGGGFYFASADVTLTCPPSSGIPCIYQGGTNGTIWSNIATYSGAGIYFTSNVTPTISGLRINTNRTLINDGGGIWVGSTSAPVMISGNDISQNTATGNGGGVFGSFPENLQLSTNFIMTNTANLGGGVALESADGLIRYNFLIANSTRSTYDGAGMSVTGFSNVTIEGNWFERNISADQAGGIYLGTSGNALVNANSFFTNTAHTGGGALTNSSGNVTFTNNIAARNTTTGTSGSGFYINSLSVPFNNNTIANNTGDGVTFVGAIGIQLYNNIVYGNTGVGLNHLDGFTYSSDYNDVAANGTDRVSVLAGAHDQAYDPLFKTTGNIFNKYHLQATSPVSTTGSLSYSPPFDIDGDRRAACTSMGADQICSKIILLPLILK